MTVIIKELEKEEAALALKPIGKRSSSLRARTALRSSSIQKGRNGAFVKDVIIGNFTKHFEYEYVPVDKLLVDARYQRPLNVKWASILARNWNEDKNNPFIVSLRSDGNYWVLDGQQRHAAIQMLQNPPEYVYAKVFKNLTLEQEADLFTSGGDDRINLTTGARYKAALVAGHPWAVAVNRAALSAGYLYVKDYPSANTLTSVAAAREILEKRGEFLLTRILKITHDVWPTSDSSARSGILHGLEALFLRFPLADDARIIQTLQSFITPRDLEHTAHGYAKILKKSISPAMGYTIYEVYNKLLRSNRLPAWTW